MNLFLCVKNYLLSNYVSFNFDNSSSRWVLFPRFISEETEIQKV